MLEVNHLVPRHSCYTCYMHLAARVAKYFDVNSIITTVPKQFESFRDHRGSRRVNSLTCIRRESGAQGRRKYFAKYAATSLVAWFGNGRIYCTKRPSRYRVFARRNRSSRRVPRVRRSGVDIVM